WLALFRARQQGSLNGVLDTAEAFGALGDTAMVEQCLRVAEGLTALHSDKESADPVRALAPALAERYTVPAKPTPAYRSTTPPPSVTMRCRAATCSAAPRTICTSPA